LRELDLELTFTGSGVAGKNVENKLSPVDYASVHFPFDIALLGRRQIVIEEDEIGGNRGGSAFDFLQFSFADQSGRIGFVAVLQEFAGDFSSCAAGQRT